MTSAPQRAAAMAALPLPVATSRTLEPACTSTASQSMSATGWMRVATAWKSPLAHITCCRCLTAPRSGASMFTTVISDLHGLVFEDGLGDVLVRELRASRGLSNDVDRTRLEQEEARLVLRDEDRAQETDRRSLPRQLCGRGTCTLRVTADGVGIRAGDVQLYEELGHGTTVRARTRGRNHGDPGS